MTEIAFEHFDPEFELGNLDLNGKPSKPRKKPGRKPNPPSPAQRKAQNRAAQRAFRERKRREMKDAETNIKKCLYMRDQAIKDCKTLQSKVDELRYENNFLKGQVLTLKIACMANRVDVPKFWDTGRRDKMGSDVTTFSRTMDIPQSLEFFLDKNKRIVTMATEEFLTPPSPSLSPHMSLNNNAQQRQQTFLNNNLIDNPSLSPPTTNNNNNTFLFDDDISNNAIQSAAALQQQPDMDPLLMQYLLQSDTITDFINQMRHVPPELWLSQVPPELAAIIPPEILINYLFKNHHKPNNTSPQPSSSSPTPTPDYYTTTFKPEIPVEVDFWVDISKNPTSSSSNKVYVAGPISTLDAVDQMRTMRDQNDSPYLQTPTELQRKIPHDPRIDLIPGPTMRDYMIIFQDYYNANELFNFLLESAMFIGGELGNQDCWFVPPSFISKYWFLCPNYLPTRPDNSVELGVVFAQKMIDTLKRRKEMYIMRDKYLDQFLPPTIKKESITDYDRMDEDEQSAYEKNSASIDLLVIESINKDIPRIISPNAFTV